jgi:hypothetical protein
MATNGWDIGAVLGALKTWADARTGLTFVLTGQQAAPPALPYGTIQILSGPVSDFADGQEHVYNSGADEIDYRIRNIGVATFRFQTYSQPQGVTTLAQYYLEQLVGSLNLPSTIEDFAAVGISALSSPPVTDISEAIANETMGRATVDISFNVPTQVVEQVSYVDIVTGTGTVADNSDDISVPYQATT